MFRRLRLLRVALLAPFRRRAVEQDIDDEFALHLELRADDLVRQGAPRDEAMRRARMEFGGVAAMKETARAAWGMTWLDHLARDVRYAWRMLRKNPAFAAVAVLSLGFGIGASTTVFSVIDALDFRPLPYTEGDRLLWLAEITPPRHEICSICPFWTSAPTALAWAAQGGSFGSVAATRSAGFKWAHDDVEESLEATAATPGFFALLGVRPVVGRFLSPVDTAAGAEPVAVLSYEFWHRRLGGDLGVVGSRLRTTPGAQPVTIVGVLPPGFRFWDAADLWMPLRLGANSSRTARSLTVVARLAPGRTVASATAELQTISARLAAESPAAYREWGAAAQPLRTLLTTPAGNARFALFAITMLVLLVAALNVAGLLLARTLARQPELAMRRALGASRRSVLRQLLVEGSCIGLGGGALGILIAYWAIRLVPRWFSMDSLGIPARLDHRVLTFAVVVSVLVGAAAAVAPAIRAAAMDAGGTPRRGTADLSAAGAHGSRVSSVLITLQIAVALILLTSATLLSRDFLALRYLDLGYDPDGLYSTSIAGTPIAGRTPADLAAWSAVAEQARARVSAVPGVVSVSLEHLSPIHPAIVRPDGGAVRTDSSATPVVRTVDANYFTTFGTRLMSGRSFGPADDRGAPPVAIVNQAAAAAFWPGADPIGRRIHLGDSTSGGELVTVVGVSADMESAQMVRRHWPVVYRPFPQGRVYHGVIFTHLRIAEGGLSVLPAAERAIREVTNRAPRPFESNEEDLNDEFVVQRLNALALDVFAAFGLLLAAMGIYGSVAYAVTRRTREIGIRTALGAQRWSIARLVGRRGVALAAGGIVLGCAGAMAVARLLESLMAATSSASPWMLTASAVAMAVVVLVATFVPAARATRIDVMLALRGE